MIVLGESWIYDICITLSSVPIPQPRPQPLPNTCAACGLREDLPRHRRSGCFLNENPEHPRSTRGNRWGGCLKLVAPGHTSNKKLLGARAFKPLETHPQVKGPGLLSVSTLATSMQSSRLGLPGGKGPGVIFHMF